MRKIEFTDKQIAEKIAEIFQDLVFNENLLGQYVLGLIHPVAFQSRLDYLVARAKSVAPGWLEDEAARSHDDDIDTGDIFQ